MNSKLIDKTLNEILDQGIAGKLEYLSKEDWLLLDSLINQSCKTNYSQGSNEGYKIGYREWAAKFEQEKK